MYNNSQSYYGYHYQLPVEFATVVRAEEQHENFVITDSGLVINPKFPHLGASPDDLIACDCCGLGCLEIKCPYCNKDSLPESANFIEDDSKLKKSHEYYYQVQMQIYLRKVKFCDFAVWTKKGIHVERIVAEQEEFFTDVIADVNEFDKFCLLPELVLLNPNTIRYVCQGLYIIQTCVQSRDTLVINIMIEYNSPNILTMQCCDKYRG